MSSKRVGAPLGDTDAGKGGVKSLRVCQIVVNLVLLNEHDSPVTPDAVVFAGNENGTAAENLAAWLENLPMQLHLAANASPEENGTA